VSDPAVRLLLTNRSEKSVSLVLEPAGEIYPMDPGQARQVRYTGDPAPKLSIDIDDAW